MVLVEVIELIVNVNGSSHTVLSDREIKNARDCIPIFINLSEEACAFVVIPLYNLGDLITHDI